MYRVISWVYTVDKDSTNFRGSQNKTSFYRYQSQSKVSAIVTDIFFCCCYRNWKYLKGEKIEDLFSIETDANADEIWAV